MKFKSEIYAVLLCGLVVAAPSAVEGQVRRKARAKRQTPKVIPKPVGAQKARINPVGGLTAMQKQAASSAIRELRKLAAAVRVGLNSEKYGDRLIDAKGEVDNSLAVLPNGALKTNIAASIRAYEDAKKLWDASHQTEDIAIYGFTAREIFKRYGLTFHEPKADDGDVMTDENAMTARARIENVEIPIGQIWDVARQHIDKAAALVK